MRWTTFWGAMITPALYAAPVYADVSQAEVTAFFKAHPPANVQRFAVVAQIEFPPGGNDCTKSKISVDPATTKVTPGATRCR